MIRRSDCTLPRTGDALPYRYSDHSLSRRRLSRTLEFLALKDFQIDRCPNLHTIQLRAPKLLTCTAKHNPLLETVQIKTAPIVHVDCTYSSKAHVTHVQMECIRTLKGHTN